jgi:NAD(P)-dependent dehydrogenase (short-subunit alcohol dehydrogenase family)
MFDSLSGKKVVIIGASSGIDLAIAEKLLTLGAKVVLSHASQEKFAATVALISGEIEAKTVNFLQEDSVNAFFAEIGNFDHLVVTSLGDRKCQRLILTEITAETARGGMEKFWGTFLAVRGSLKTSAKDKVRLP